MPRSTSFLPRSPPLSRTWPWSWRRRTARTPTVFGLYHGVPLPERGDVAGLPPDTVSIYRRPLEAAFPDPTELRDEIRITVLHELAHYFGFDEEGIAELGYD